MTLNASVKRGEALLVSEADDEPTGTALLVKETCTGCRGIGASLWEAKEPKRGTETERDDMDKDSSKWDWRREEVSEGEREEDSEGQDGDQGERE